MKKIIIALIFIPFIAFGQTDAQLDSLTYEIDSLTSIQRKNIISYCSKVYIKWASKAMYQDTLTGQDKELIGTACDLLDFPYTEDFRRFYSYILIRKREWFIF